MTTGEPSATSTSASLPDRARVVVVGGGIIGTSVAYHLAHLGVRDVVLLERDRLTSGTTWHAAGLMATFGSTSETSTELRKYSRDLYLRLEAETGLATGMRQVGLIELAIEPGRLEEYRRVAAFNRHCGVEVHEISAREVAELWPLAQTDDVLAGFYIPADGRVNPVDVTMSLAKGARQQGARIIEGVPVTGFLSRNGAVTGVRTARGDIEAEYVVNCTGMWARQLGELAGVSIPLQAAEHYYLLTEPIAEVSRDWPVLEDPANYGYFREEGGGLMLGMFEPVCAPWKVEGIPPDFSFGELPPDWERMGPFLEKTMSRIPVSSEVGIRKFFCGPESFTPDLAPVLGEAPELKNYFVAAGLNSIGILTGGGIGRVLAHWIASGSPDVDITGMNIDRLHPYQATPEYRATRTVESLGMVYATHYPGRSMRTARGARLSPLHHRLAARGAFFRDVSGWEGPDWYAPEGSFPPGSSPDAGPLSFGRQDWYPHWEAEHHACREGVIVMDMSFMAKFAVQGRDAGRELDRLSAGRVNAEDGVITYTQWLNEQGRLEADLTVTRLAEDDFYVVASDTAHRHALTRMRRHFAASGAHAFVTDVTSAYAQLNVQGPHSRALLAAVTTADVSDEALPFRAARFIDIGFARVLCLRITYLGELGYELHIPAEQAVGVYDRLVEAGRELGLRHAGLKALSSLRMEKGYRDYGHDIDNTDTVLEAGLGFAVALDKPGGFIGRDAVAAQKAAGPLSRRLVQVLLADPEPLLFHAEVVRRNGTEVGYVRAASYGWTLGGAVGLAMIDSGGTPADQSWLDSGDWTVQVGERIVPARLSLRPLYDPASKRIRM
ncbi:MAG TPA: FAD-dependent oxidoreductase [Streptosporangiaceae bacterium]|jgi:4-methylaminobutanoate oxidase (formaldehyde-forming)|nr:FAD-dependent oxidoreductase [Streptosporangiaceae bacterium]